MSTDLHDQHNLPFEYEPDNPIVTISLNREQMEKFAKTELENNSLDSDAFHWLLTEATPEDIKKIENSYKTRSGPPHRRTPQLMTSQTDSASYVQAYQASGTITTFQQPR